MTKTILNKEQEQAVQTVDGAYSIIAAAGSGKTLILIERIKNLIENHKVFEKDILLVTFTKNTATEMQSRLNKLGYSHVNAGTFHSICGQILRQEGIQINPRNMIKDWQADNCFKKIDKLADTKDILSFISFQRNRMIGVDDEFAPKSSIYNEQQLRVFFKAYEDFKSNNNLYDFDDYLVLCLDVLKKKPNKHTFKYILVDEHQDSNAIQNELLKHWCQSGNLFVVGDFRQCFLPETKIRIDKDTTKAIKDITPNDKVTVANGRGGIVETVVSETSKKYYTGKIVTVKTESGKEIKATPEHIIFAHQSGVFNDNNTETFTMFGSNKYSNGYETPFEGYDHELSTNHTGIKISGDHDKLSRLAEEAENTIENTKVVRRAVLTKNLKQKFFLMPIVNACEGMKIPVYHNGEIVSERITEVSQEEYSGYVYDLNIDYYRNYLVNDIAVHNCIYGFRGSSPEHIMNLKKGWKDAKTLNVRINYRSRKNIVDKANNFIKRYYNDYEHYRDAEPYNQEDGHIEVNSYTSRGHEGEEVANKIQKLLDEGTKPSDIAVLYRNNKHADFLENQLKKRKIDYEISNDGSFFKRREIAGILSFLRLAKDHEDNNAFEGVFRLRVDPLKFFSNVMFRDIQGTAEDRDIPLFDALIKTSYPKPWYMKSAVAFRSRINKIQALLHDGKDLSVAIDQIVELFKFKSMINEKYTHQPEKEERLESIETLKLFAKGNNIDDFLEFAYSDSGKKKEKKTDSVQLMTIHRSKGLEWDNVFVIGVEDKEFPSQREGAMNDIKEEARLFYVGVSRPVKRLYISEIGQGNKFIEEYVE